MKRLILSIAFIALSSLAFTQAPPPPPGDPGNGGTNGPVGGNAPVGSGVAILLALGSVYAEKKTIEFRERE
jgi:hypothetical protein